MSFLAKYKTDKTLEEEGVWVDFGDGVRVKIRRANSEHSRKTRAKLQKKHFAPYRNMEPPEDVVAAMVNEHLSQSLVVDWEGVTLEDGIPLPCNPENIAKVMHQFPDFRDDIITAATEKATFQREELEAKGKNSKSA